MVKSPITLPAFALLTLVLPTSPATAQEAAQKKAFVHAATVEAFETARLFARVSGFVKMQRVDIGDRVKQGDVLATLDVPELWMQLEVDTASTDQAKARMLQARARINGAEAELDGTRAGVLQAEAALKNAEANLKLRELTFERMKRLHELKSIEPSLLEESKERYSAAVGTLESAKAALVAAKALIGAAQSKIEQAKADLMAREAAVKVAQATRDRSRLLLEFANVLAPFEGVITTRGYSRGELVLTTDKTPIVTLQRTDVLRVVVFVPEREAAQVNVGQPVLVEINALPGKKFVAKVSRTSASLDAEARTMRVEIDMPNPTGQIRPGMSARVTIELNK